MALLIAGVLFWSAVHLFPAVMPGKRAGAIEKFGEKTYKASFAITMLIALLLIIFGWQSAGIDAVYVPPLYGSPVIGVLMFISFTLFAAANAPGNVKRFLRHPMLTGLITWGAAHLLANGDERSIVLFGGLSLWALLETILISNREGRWEKAEPVPLSRDLMTVVASAVIFFIVVYFHAKLFGVPAYIGFPG